MGGFDGNDGTDGTEEWPAPAVACECGEPEGDLTAAPACGCCGVTFDRPEAPEAAACECCSARAGWDVVPGVPSELPGPPPGSASGTRRAGRGRRNGNTYSTVFTVRIGHLEWRALQRRAAEKGMGPSVLVRALVRQEIGDVYGW